MDDEIVDDFISRVNLYGKHKPISFDLRGYAEYIDEHSLDAVDDEVLRRFEKQAEEK